jgi:MFS transporter, DHA1 family, tetracycline resistance protein
MHTASPSFRNLLRGRVLQIAVASWCFTCGSYGIFSVLGFHVQDRFALDAADAARTMGLGLMGAAGVSVLMQTFVIRRLKASSNALVLIGVPVALASFAMIWFGTDVWMFVVALMLNGFGQSFVNPALTTALSLSAGASGQGRLAGLSTSIQALAFLVGPVSSAAMYAAMPLLPFLVGGAMTAVSLGLMLAIRPQTAAESADLR